MGAFGPRAPFRFRACPAFGQRLAPRVAEWPLEKPRFCSEKSVLPNPDLGGFTQKKNNYWPSKSGLRHCPFKAEADQPAHRANPPPPHHHHHQHTPPPPPSTTTHQQHHQAPPEVPEGGLSRKSMFFLHTVVVLSKSVSLSYVFYCVFLTFEGKIFKQRCVYITFAFPSFKKRWVFEHWMQNSLCFVVV